jgi:hypothetical protein
VNLANPARLSRIAIPPNGCEDLLPVIRYLKDTDFSNGDGASPLEHDIILLSPPIVQT